jgi:uncharacterized protein with PQ loop repeat
MKFDLIDDSVSLPMNIFLIIGNVICIGYNIPQMIQTYKSKSTKDINIWFLILRIIGNVPFVVYSIQMEEANLIISYLFSVFSSVFILYFKFLELKYLNLNTQLEKNLQSDPFEKPVESLV